MLDHGNAQLSPVGFFNPMLGQAPVGTFFGGGVGAADGKGFRPFSVRWVSHDTRGDSPRSGEWQIYLPFGSLVVHYGSASFNCRSYAARTTNEEGETAGGKTTYQWFKIPYPMSSDADIQVINGRVHKTWTVYVLTKPWARFLVSTCATDNDPVAWADAVATIGVAEYTDSGGVLHVSHSVVQHFSGGMTKTWDNQSEFAVDYELSDETGSGYTANVINQTKMLGRLQEENVNPVDVRTATEVWIRIEHSGENFELSVLASAPDDTESNDDQTVYKIYDMKDGVVTRDYRDSIPELPFYTNSASGGSGGGDG